MSQNIIKVDRPATCTRRIQRDNKQVTSKTWREQLKANYFENNKGLMAMYWIVFLIFVASGLNALPITWGPKCQSQPVDIAFLLQSSESLTKEHFLNAKKGLLYAADKLHKDAQMAVLTFNTNPELIFNFNTLQHQGIIPKAESIKRLIEKITGPFKETDTYIDKALEMANKDIFTEAAGMRPNARKVMVVLTNGIQTKNKGYYTSLSVASQPLKNKGVHVYTLGMGDDIDVMELIMTASTPDNVYSFKSLTEDRKLRHELVNKMLGTVCPTAPPPTTKTPLEVIAL